MQLPDVNVLVYAFRPESPQHTRYRAWLKTLTSGKHRYAISELILSSVVRFATSGDILKSPQKIAAAFEYSRSRPQCALLSSGPTHWQIFSELCLVNKVAGTRVDDVYLAALAIEHGCELVTSDRDFARFPGLRWRHPLD